MAQLSVRKEEYDLDLTVIHVMDDLALADLIAKIDLQIRDRGGFWVEHRQNNHGQVETSLRWIPAATCQIYAEFDGHVPATVQKMAVAIGGNRVI